MYGSDENLRIFSDDFNHYQKGYGENYSDYEERESADIWNAIFYSYKFSLGDFDTESFQGEYEGALWILFIVGTFVL